MFDFPLSCPLAAKADTAKYQVPEARLFNVHAFVVGLLITSECEYTPCWVPQYSLKPVRSISELPFVFFVGGCHVRIADPAGAGAAAVPWSAAPWSLMLPPLAPATRE